MALLSLLLLLSLMGCFNPFAPKLVDDMDSTDLVVTNQQSPDEVLQNFKVAYTFRDSLLYSDLLDTSFLFKYYDPDEGASGGILTWTKETDLYITGRLFRHFEIIDLVWNTTLYEWENEETGQISRGYSLTLIGEDSDYQLSGRAIFSFKKCVDERWRITDWKDESDI